jgi:NAD(P)-dependent dehydrogenase (short-subunit alcohol dehydrogenase family)
MASWFWGREYLFGTSGLPWCWVPTPSAGAALMAGAAAAIEGLTRGLAVELAPVRVNAVRPGAVHTPMWDAAPEPQRSALLGALAVRTIT